MKKVFFILALVFLTSTSSLYAAITANPIISRGKPVYTSSGKAQYLVDDKFNTTSFNVSNGSWIAIQVDQGSSKVFLNWNNPVYAWSNELAAANCPNTTSFPIDYNLLVSSNSTNGADGDWTIADSIRGNIVTARGHLIGFTGKSWVKMAIIKGGGQIDEVEIFDASKGDSDVWFFAGTSISANTYKGTPPAQNFADLVSKGHPGYNPAMVRGGIGCISSTDLVKNLSKYLKMAGNAHFWAIEMGTNDAWGGSNGNVTTFKKNMQTVIDSCKKAGIQPIIARVLATNESAAKWQVNPEFLKAVDDLTITNKLIAGPDLYTWFLANPKNLNDDGIHPNASGAASIQRLWAQKMDSLYVCTSSDITPYLKINSGAVTSSDSASLAAGDTLTLTPQASTGGLWSWSGPNGFSSASREIVIDTIQTKQAGTYIATYRKSDSCISSYTFDIVVKKKIEIILSDKTGNFSIFPNPAEGKFSILLNNFSGNSRVQIYDMQGKLAYTKVLINKETELYTRLPQGIYIIKITQKQKTFNQTLIIQ